jgi:hypothetical protein
MRYTYKKPRPLAKDDWVLILETNEKAVIEKVLDDGERFLLRVPSFMSWPWPRWVHVPREKIKRIKPPKFNAPKIDTGEALL